MSNERIRSQVEKEKKLKTEAEQKEEIAHGLEFQKEKTELLARLEKKKELQFLKSLVERGLLGVHSAERIASEKDLNSDDIADIFSKIDAIEAIPKIDSILPKELRLTQEEYANALAHEEKRSQAIQKLDDALQYLFASTHSDAFSPISIFFSSFMMLGKYLVIVQENTIDIKRSLIPS